MGGEWAQRRLGDDALIKGRIGWKGYKKTDLRESGPLVVGGVNVKNSIYLDLASKTYLSREKYEESPEIVLKKGDVLLVQRGNGIGDVGYFDGSIEEATINPTMIIISEFCGNPQYLFYYLASAQGRENVLSLASGSSIPALYQKPLADLKYPAPPRAIQDEIVEVLSALDDKIELNRKMNETLEAMAQALFKSWFVDFDPVIDNALKAGKPIPEELAQKAAVRKAIGKDRKALPEDIQKLFPDEFVCSEEMGWIPVGWGCKRLGDVTSYLKRGIGPKYIEQGGVRVLNQRCIRDSRVSLRDARHHDAEKKKIDGIKLQPGDVLVNSTGVGTLGRAAQLPDFQERLIADSHVTIVRADGNGVTQNYLAMNLLSRQAELANLGEGSTGQTELGRGVLSDLSLLCPTKSIQDQFAIASLPSREMMFRNERESDSLVSLRDMLLQKLLSGEIGMRADQSPQDIA